VGERTRIYRTRLFGLQDALALNGEERERAASHLMRAPNQPAYARVRCTAYASHITTGIL
jgi:hypothetical protein